MTFPIRILIGKHTERQSGINMPEAKVYDGKAHAEARPVKLVCGHPKMTYQVITSNTRKIYCGTCDTDVTIKSSV